MPALRIMTANLLVDRADPDALGAAIKEHDPDVVAVQELGPRTASLIESLLPHGHLDPRDDGFGLGIAARRPVEVERLDLAERSGWVATLDQTAWGLNQPFAVIDVHLINPIVYPWNRSRQHRGDQIAGVAEYVAGIDHPYAIVGDMNTTPAWPEYRQLTALGADVARATGTASRTWSHFLWGPRLLRIDHGFVSGVKPVTTRTIGIDGTDHRALVIDLEV